MLRKLLLLDAATEIRDLTRPPGNRLRKLAGRRSEDWSLHVNDPWRITFRWSAGQAERVRAEDCH